MKVMTDKPSIPKLSIEKNVGLKKALNKTKGEINNWARKFNIGA